MRLKEPEEVKDWGREIGEEDASCDKIKVHELTALI